LKERSKIDVVVGMVVRDENGPEVPQGKPGERHLSRNAIATVDDVGLAPGNDRLRASRPPFPRPRATCGSKEDESRAIGFGLCMQPARQRAGTDPGNDGAPITKHLRELRFLAAAVEPKGAP
jgi:hypothetical protein